MKFNLLIIVTDNTGTILGANRSFLKSSGYTIQEIYHKPLKEIIYSETDFTIDSKFSLENVELTIRKKDGSYLYFLGDILPLIIREKEIYLIRGYDITEVKQLERILKIIRTVNSIIISSKTKREIYERICKSLIEDFGLQMAWIGEVKDGQVIPVYSYGHVEGYFDKTGIVLDQEAPGGQEPISVALREGRIFINPDSRTNPSFITFRDEALKREYLSSVTIPLIVQGRLQAILSLYSREPNYFNERIYPILEELKSDLEFALEKLEKEKIFLITSTAFTNSDNLVIVTDNEGRIVYVNNFVELLLGIPSEELIGQPITTLEETSQKSGCPTELEKLLHSEGTFSGITNLRKRSGEVISLELKVIKVQTAEEDFFVWIGRDLTLEFALLETIENLKNFDPLTGMLTLKSALSKAKEVLPFYQDLMLVLVVDLYQFTYINETYGVSIGDQVLKTISDRLKEVVGEKNILARVASDEFLIFAFEFTSHANLALFIENIKRVFRDPLVVEGKHITLKYNFGIAIYPQDGTDPEDLYKKASSACAFAKKDGPNTVRFYEPKLEVLIQKTLTAESLIEEALREKLFQFFFQPYFYTGTNSLAGAEALVRIVKPNGEIIPPGVFIETLEISPFRKEFEIWALRTIIEKINSLCIPIGLNLYPKTFQDEHFWLLFEEELAGLRYPLILEITERGFLDNPEKTIKVISHVRKWSPNIKLALDDFGTGYSNLGYLKQLPLDVVKIDILFVRDIVEGAKERGIVKTIIDLAHILGAKALAEGVETREHFEILDIMGCDFVQGYYFDKPLPEKEFIKKYLPNLCSQSPQSETQS